MSKWFDTALVDADDQITVQFLVCIVFDVHRQWTSTHSLILSLHFRIICT